MDAPPWNRRRLADDADDFEDAYAEDAATQQAASQQTQEVVEPTQVARATDDSPAATVEIVRCMLCSMNITTKSVVERELHLNTCLDSASLEAKYDCPTCGKELTDYNEQRRAAHVNLCLDRIARFTHELSTVHNPPPRRRQDSETSDVHAVATDSGDLYTCRICGLQLTLPNLEARSRHVKQCGQRFGLRAGDMAALTEPGEAVDGEDDSESQATQAAAAAPVVDSQESADNRPNAFSRLMAASASRPNGSSGIGARIGAVASNAFDILMKSSMTEAVVQAAASTSARSFWHTSAGGSSAKPAKRMRFTPSTSSSHQGPPRRFACPDFKRILGTQPPFIVDGFRHASKSLSSVYFLTHFHSDHYVGLQKSFDCGIIYCNHVTAALTIQELGIDPKWVHPVPMNTSIDIRGVQVTFMDANHCPGAAIILFKLRSGVTYLHTGDFRFHPKMWQYAALQPFLPSTAADTGEVTPPARRMDGVYLDTTYADPKYTFPTQESSIQHALTLVDKHMDAGEKVLFLFGSYSIGKERLFMEVALRHQRKVCVSKAKLKMIKTYAWPESQTKMLTTEPGATNLHVVPMQELKLDHLTALLQKHRLRFHQIVAFRPTGWTFSRSNASMASCQSDASGSVRIYGIPYSEHSSFAELCEFVRVVNPLAIIPTVNCHSERSVKRQVDALRQSAFHGIGAMFGVQPKRSAPQPTAATDADRSR